MMVNFSYLSFRRKDWNKETSSRNYTSGAQLVTDRPQWGSVWLGICFPKDYEQQNNEAMENSLQAFGNEGGDKYQMWREYRFSNWCQENFMITAINNPDGIVEELADGLVDLAMLVENQLAAARTHHDDG